MALTRWFTAVCVAVAIHMGAPSVRADTLPNLPDNPSPNSVQASQDTNTPPAASQSDAGDSSAQSTPENEEERRKLAQEQLESQLHQRVFAVMATFNTTANKDAVPLSTKQKYVLFFRSASDPWPFVLNAVGAGIDQADNSFPEYGQGVQGYAKRFGAAYTDYFTGNLLGNAVLASLLKEDPRYFQKGTGSFTSRFLWASTSTVWCKRDNQTWGPNYANVMGNLMGAAISNTYYPESQRTVGNTLERGFTVTAQAIIGSEVIEFWPDMVRYHRRKVAEKLANKMGQTAEPYSAQPAGDAPPAQP
ncbi:MAG: hypothetical protein WA510_31690 [Acidobacteriaceae bacterium]